MGHSEIRHVPYFSRRSLIAASGLIVLATLVAAPVVALRGSLPALDGIRALAGPAAPVAIERDALGVPTVIGESRTDVAFATGYLHAQDRFFQMDLARRMSAGRLAELVGDAALPSDRRNRLHRFDALAARVLAAATAEERALLQAYSAGVNAGLTDLRVRPFEYLLLRSRPRSWQPADSILVIYSMYLQLNDSRADADRRRAALRDSLAPALFDFVHAVAPEWEAPIDGAVTPPASIPGPEILDLRAPATQAAERARRRGALAAEPALPGSNNWALAGARTARGSGMVANDMHLGLGVPNTWYRARLIVRGREARDLAGLTLPGAPLLVAGSNGRVAWGFTNSYGDYSDLVDVQLSPDGTEYRGREGRRPIVIEHEILESSSGRSEILELKLTEWGPLLDPPADARSTALRWTAHVPEATNLRWVGLETVADVRSALALANVIGGPVQNFVCADVHGSVGWTLLGRIPDRGAGYDPSVPGDWTRPDAGWRGFLPPERYPRVIDPPGGQLWTANNRVVGGDALALIGNGAPDRGARARQIRDSLAALTHATEQDMLAIQLDDRAVFLERWRRLLLDTLDSAALAGNADRAALRKVLEGDALRASVESTGYAYLRRFREDVALRMYETLTAAARLRHPEIELRVPREFEEPAWRLVTEQPMHLLDPRYDSWRDLLLSSADEAVISLRAECSGVGVGGCPWGARNAVNIRHPLSRAMPSLARWLDMPATPMGGDNDMPHVHQPGFGASERFVVSPGYEAEGILHMPGGQSGHPWSPYYRAGHEAWLTGEPTSFLPGPARHKLVLQPARAR